MTTSDQPQADRGTQGGSTASAARGPAISHEHRDVTGGWLRPAVFGAMDGLVTNVSLIAGVGGGGGSQHAIVLTGLAGLAAGAFSMAAGEFVSVSSQNELVMAEVAKERRELEHNAAVEQAELVGMLRARGISPATARQAAAEISAHPDKALEIHAMEELGVNPQELPSPFVAAGASLASFAVGAVIPLLPYLLGANVMALALGLSALAAVVGGGLVARLTERPFWRGAVRQLALGAVAAGFTYLIGLAVGGLALSPGGYKPSPEAPVNPLSPQRVGYPMVRCPVATVNRPLRVALLSYRSKPHSGGQGVYVRHLSRELAALGHHVEVLSGQPYPVLDPGPVLREVPSLDLYRDEDPFRTPALAEFRDWADAVETVMMWSGAFPEPLTFSVRALRALRSRVADFDIVHDNQGLGYGMLGVRGLGLPLVTSIHHPITVDRRLDLAGLSWPRRLAKGRWYGFVRMQGRVARRAGPLITVSESSKADICRDFRVPPSAVRIVPLGVDTRRFRPSGGPRARGRIVAVTSADSPLKGLGVLLRALAKVATERDVHLVVVGTPSDATRALVTQLSLAERVTFSPGLSDDDYAALLASAEIGVVPSLYEGFSLPAVEHMASGTPLVATRAGALPEVTGDAALLVAPGDPEELAATLRRLHDSPAERAAFSDLALRRVSERFAWPAVAAATAAIYRDAIDHGSGLRNPALARGTFPHNGATC